MTWFDNVLQSRYKAKAGMASAWNSAKTHFPEVKSKAQAWITERKAEHQQLSAARENAKQRIEALKNNRRFAGMSHEQRAAEVTQTAQNMPGNIAIAHAHPVGKVITAPFRILGSGLLALGKKSAAITPRITPGSNTWFIFLAIMYHMIIIFGPGITLTTRIILNFIMIFLTIIIIFDPSERNGDTYKTLFLWVFIPEIFIPYAANEIKVLQNFDFIRLYLANGFIVLTWIYYAIFVRGKDITKGPTKWLRALIILFWFGVAMSFIGTSLVDFTDVELDTASTDAWFAAQQVFSKMWDGWGLMWNTVVNSFSNIQTIFSMRMKQATGEYYFGVVEENEQEQLGVYLENLKASQSEFEENEPVIVYATLNAKTVDDMIYVKVGCYAGEKANKIAGIVYPSESFEISNLQQEELDCTFERLTKGTHKVTYTADFNFETIGYLKRYFADRNAITAATRQNIDLLDEYQIIDQNPVAHYTNGPVAMGIGPEQVLVGVSSDYSVKPRLAFTLDSTKGWGGTITQLNEVVLFIPNEMSLDTEQCTDKNWQEYSVDDCVESELAYSSKISQQCNDDESCIEEQCSAQLEEYHAYMLDVSSNPSYTNIQDYITLSCRLNIDDVVGLLEATPIATHYFYVKTRYQYESSEDTSVSVVSSQDESPITVSGEEQVKSGSVPTFTLSNSEEELQFIFYNYGDYLFNAQQQFSVPVCTIAGIIAYTSHSNPDYYDTDKGKKGLMGIPDTLAQQYASAAGITSTFSSYDVETNIKIGTAVYASLSGDDDEKLSDYHAKINSLSAPDSDSPRYAAFVKNYKTDCEELELENSQLQTETGIDNALHNGQYITSSLSTPAVFMTYQTIPYALSSTTSTIHSQGIEYIFVYLLENGEKIDSVTIGMPRWYSFEKNPFIQVYYDYEEVMYRYFADFVTNTNYLTEDRDVALIEDVIYIEYTGSEIQIKLANNPTDLSQYTEVCSVPWTASTAYQTCDDLPGLVIRNVWTDEKTLGTGMASVQLDWSIARQMEAMT